MVLIWTRPNTDGQPKNEASVPDAEDQARKKSLTLEDLVLDLANLQGSAGGGLGSSGGVDGSV